MDWSTIRYFTEDEFRCQGEDCCGGQALMDEHFVGMLDALRYEFGRPLRVNSGYRCPLHNSRVSSTGEDGPHTTGKAVDLGVSGQDADKVLGLAYLMGFQGKGVNQKGGHSSRFIHLDLLGNRVWSY